MAFGKRVKFDPIIAIAFGSITSSFAKLGSKTGVHTRIMMFNNTTDSDISISIDDGTNEHIRVAAKGAKSFDFTANEVTLDGYFLSRETQFYIKYTSDAPTLGNFWIELASAEGGQ